MRARYFAFALPLLCLLACSPALNWRQVALGASKPMLPCKPDKAQRSVMLGGQAVNLDMVGCETSGALFAVSRVEIPRGVESQTVLADWYRASLGNLGDPQSQMAMPPLKKQSLAVSGVGKGPDGQALQARFLWQLGSREIFLMAVYAPKVDDSMTEPFLIDLKLP